MGPYPARDRGSESGAKWTGAYVTTMDDLQFADDPSECEAVESELTLGIHESQTFQGS